MNDSTQQTPSKFKKLLQCIHSVVQELAPWSILLAALGLGIAIYELNLDRNVRSATLFFMASERMDAARELDKKDGRVSKTQVGQNHILEKMVEMNIELYSINASRINLIDADLTSAKLYRADLSCSRLHNANLKYANLSDADLGLAKLSKTDFSGATLTNAKFEEATLYKTKFNGANLRNANFDDACIQNVDFTSAKNLKNNMFKYACGKNITLPAGFENLKECSNKQRKLCRLTSSCQ